MKYHITTLTHGGEYATHSLDLAVEDTISWQDFVNLSPVRQLEGKIVDITPDGMPDQYTDPEQLNNSRRYFT
jgi:hypothetical protein